MRCGGQSPLLPESPSGQTSTASQAQPGSWLHSLSLLMQASPHAWDSVQTRQQSSAGVHSAAVSVPPLIIGPGASCPQPSSHSVARRTGIIHGLPVRHREATTWATPVPRPWNRSVRCDGGRGSLGGRCLEGTPERIWTVLCTPDLFSFCVPAAVPGIEALSRHSIDRECRGVGLPGVSSGRPPPGSTGPRCVRSRRSPGAS